MHQPEDNREHQDLVEAPAELVRALKHFDAAPFIPPAVDEAILRSARCQLGRRAGSGLLAFSPGLRFSWRLAPWAAALAAATLVGVLLLPLQRSHQLTREDLNRDGRVDILDAFALARALNATPVLKKAPDINGDGVTDQLDVNAIAAQAVSLQKGGSS